MLPLIVGLTGGIGSGKSTVCEVFKHLQIPVYDSDTEAKRLMQENPDLISFLKKEFGEHIFDKKGKLQRKQLAALVFQDKGKLQKLNGAVHPAVYQDFIQWVKKQESPYVLKESALISKKDQMPVPYDLIVAVLAPEALRLQRVIRRDQTEEEQVKKRMRHQISDAERKAQADYILINDEEHLLLPQILDLHKKIMQASYNRTLPPQA